MRRRCPHCGGDGDVQHGEFRHDKGADEEFCRLIVPIDPDQGVLL